MPLRLFKQLSEPVLRRTAAGRLRRGRILPPAAKPSAAGEGRIVVASYNIHKCVGTDGKFDPERIANVIAELKADIIALQEADRRFGTRHGLLDTAVLKSKTGLSLVPVSDQPGGHGWHGNALLVRTAVATRVRRLTLPFAEPRGAVVAELDFPSGPLRVIAAHLSLFRHYRRRQADAILRVIERDEAMPTILMGDLNEWRPGPGRSVLATLEPYFGVPAGECPSFPSRLPVFALDRILGRPAGTIEALQVHDTPLARIASDHLPLKAVVNLSAAAALAP